MTNAQLQEGSKHVVYEWDMLLGLANLLRNPPRLGGDQALVEYACVESFLIHGRQPALFFHQEKAGNKKPTDLYASLYVANWSSIGPRWTPSLQALKHEGDKRVAHLTTHRFDDAPRAIQQWAYELSQHISVFEAAAPPDLFVAKRKTPLLALAVANEGVTTTSSAFTGSVLIPTK
jgi:hypothetical protein